MSIWKRFFGKRDSEPTEAKPGAMGKCVECEYRGEWEEHYGKLYMKCRAPEPPTRELISFEEAQGDSPCDQYLRLVAGEHQMLYRSEVDIGKALRLRAHAYLITGVKLKGQKRNFDGSTYEVYGCRSRNTALDFLRRIPGGAIPPLYYIIVETPYGNVGKDMDGMFDEQTQEKLT